MMGAQAYGVMMWVSPCERCEQLVWGQAINKVHRYMSLYELFVSSLHKRNVAEKEQQS